MPLEFQTDRGTVTVRYFNRPPEGAPSGAWPLGRIVVEVGGHITELPAPIVHLEHDARRAELTQVAVRAALEKAHLLAEPPAVQVVGPPLTTNA